jgi:hypothetical protein
MMPVCVRCVFFSPRPAIATQNQNENQTFIIHEHKIMRFFSKL